MYRYRVSSGWFIVERRAPGRPMHFAADSYRSQNAHDRIRPNRGWPGLLANPVRSQEVRFPPTFFATRSTRQGNARRGKPLADAQVGVPTRATPPLLPPGEGGRRPDEGWLHCAFAPRLWHRPAAWRFSIHGNCLDRKPRGIQRPLIRLAALATFSRREKGCMQAHGKRRVARVARQPGAQPRGSFSTDVFCDETNAAKKCP